MGNAARGARLRSAAKLLLKALASGGLIALIIYKTDTRNIIDRLLAVSPAVVLGAATLLAVLAILPALRWRILARVSGGEFSVCLFYQLLMIGNFLAQAIPSLGSDGVRAWYLHRNGMWLAAAANSVLLDRLTALGAVLLLSVLFLPWLSNIVPPLIVWWMAGMMFGALIAAAAALRGFDWIPARFARWRIVLMAQHLSDTTRALLRDRAALLRVLALSMVVQLLLSVIVYGLALAVQVPFTLADCVLLFPLVMLVSTIPIGIAGWGVREGAMVIAFGFLNVPPSDALLVSILFGIVVAISTVPGLVFWLKIGREFKREMTAHDQ